MLYAYAVALYAMKRPPRAIIRPTLTYDYVYADDDTVGDVRRYMSCPAFVPPAVFRYAEVIRAKILRSCLR